ncbi:MAG: hypothetical protein AAF629_14545 [Chloroflexota bacterium]
MIKKRSSIRLYISLALAGLVMLWLWPSVVAALPLTPKDQLVRAWRFATDIGRYDYSSTVLKTDHPTHDIRNVGRTAETKRVMAQGSVDLSNQAISMKLWTVGIDKDGIEIKVENGKAYGRLNQEGGWIEMQNPNDMFAPGGDPLGFLLAAHDIKRLPEFKQSIANTSALDAFVADPNNEIVTGYGFQIKGVRYAEYVRQRLQESMREQGELPANVTLGVIAQYVDMTV